MKCLVFIILSFIIINSSHSQTCIIVVLQNDVSTIGADGRVSNFIHKIDFNGAEHDTTIYGEVCKINQEGNMILTGQGFLMDVLFKYAHNLKKNANSIVYPFKEVVPVLEDTLEFYRIKSIPFYLKHCKGYFAHLVFVWAEKDTLKTYKVAFQTINPDSEHVKIDTLTTFITSNEIPVNRRLVLKLGHTEAIGDEITQLLLDSLGIPQGIKRLIQLQISETPQEVGLPISIVQVTKSNVTWIQSGICNIPFTNKQQLK